jgi:hypothetical protein
MGVNRSKPEFVSVVEPAQLVATGSGAFSGSHGLRQPP